jgi:hypothetical protein
VLSIGKLSAPQANYYLDQAEARVDTVQSVGGGLEDYYSEGEEARGRWLGHAAVALGLHGSLRDGDDLRAVLEGLDPADETRLRASAVPVRVAGRPDLLGAEERQRPVRRRRLRGSDRRSRRARDRGRRGDAVRRALRRICPPRPGGHELQQVDGLVGAAFRHRSSRAGDPQLHSHVLVANLARGQDGRWSTLDGRQLYAHARAASFVYQAVLRGELTRTLGVEWTPVHKGIAEVVGIPRSVLRGFSRRRAEIETALTAHGTDGPRAAEAAALATRRAKSNVRGNELETEWRARALELGLAPVDLERITGRARSRELKARTVDDALRRLTSPNGLTRRAATFTRRDVLQQLCEQLPAGAPLDLSGLERAVDHVLASPAVIPLVDGRASDAPQSFRRRDGRVVPVGQEELRYSTVEHVTLEHRVLERASVNTGAGLADRRDVDAAIRARPTLSLEQRELVERLCLEGDLVGVVAGRAGTGKTFALAAAREAWQGAGHPVLGVAVARRAAIELRDGAGIEGTSVAALLSASLRSLPQRCVLVVDEAGMVPTREVAKLLDLVEASSGKLVLVGDHRQLPELSAGGMFRALAARESTIELVENRRQVHRWERGALQELRDGRAVAALARYERHDRLHMGERIDDARGRLVEDWWTAGGEAVMIAHRRADVADLNARARDLMRAAGALRGPGLALPGGSFAVGDRLLIKRNDRRRELVNGERGRVIDVDPEAHALLVHIGGRPQRLDREFLLRRTNAGGPSITHGYALTGHVAQGTTVDHAFVLAEGGISREWAYVALSRGRESNHLYLAERLDDAREEFEPAAPMRRGARERLIASLESSRAQVLAIDSLPEDPRRLDRHIDDIEQELAALTGERENRAWLPSQRRAAEERERRATRLSRTLGDLVRERAERVHGSREFVGGDEWDAYARRAHERTLDRLYERALRHDRSIGRER